MGNFWSNLFGRDEKRMTIDGLAEQIISYQNNGYLIHKGYRNSNVENITHDFEAYVREAHQANGVVFACATARMMVFSQVRIMYQNMKKGKPGDLVYDNALSLFEKPWYNGQTTDLLAKMLHHADYAGNFYAVTEGDRRLGTQRIRVLRPDWVDIILSAPPEEATASDIVGYAYKPGNTHDVEKWVYYPADGSNGKVCHWAPYPDPLAQYKGMSWLTPVIREVNADTAATKHKGKFFENAATPNLAVSMNETVTPEEFKEFMKMLEPKHGIDSAYETLYLGGGADVTVIGADLKQMNFKDTQGHGETRIAAAAGVHPVIVGLSEGMQGSSLNAGNFGQARRSFVDKTMTYLWTTAVNSLSVMVPERRGKRLWYDDDIPFNREDLKDQAEIQNLESTTILKLVREGFTPESVIEATMKHDWTLLEHTGLLSVQLQPPGETGGATVDDPDGDGEPTDKEGNDDKPQE